jgi:hypothetical protein
MIEIESQLTCGIVMPISAIDSCSEEHWRDVREILNEAIEDAGFNARLVSEAEDAGIIQKRIIQNLYEDPIVVCDVSGKNPNVMFELGMRLAFDKPTIIVKDDKTSYSFDTSPIEHLAYPRDLRFAKIVEFKEALSEKIKATHKRATESGDFTTFLKHFGTFKVVDLQTEFVPKDRILLEEIRGLRELLLTTQVQSRSSSGEAPTAYTTLCLLEASEETTKSVIEELRAAGIDVPRRMKTQNNHIHFKFELTSPEERKTLLAAVKSHVPDARWLPYRGGKV